MVEVSLRYVPGYVRSVLSSSVWISLGDASISPDPPVAPLIEAMSAFSRVPGFSVGLSLRASNNTTRAVVGRPSCGLHCTVLCSF